MVVVIVKDIITAVDFVDLKCFIIFVDPNKSLIHTSLSSIITITAT